MAGNVPVIGIEGLLALAGTIGRLRAGGGEGGGPRCQLMQRCPQLAASPGEVPRWEAFAEVNRALVQGLLGLLAGRMMAPPLLLAGGGERDERTG